jgi:LAO/AO transport system kinase
VEIAETAHTVVVVEAPGLGDEVQAIKAGILEIADVFAVNKADRDGADRTASALEMMLDLGGAASGRRIAPGVVSHHGRLMEVAQGTPQSPDEESRASYADTSEKDGWRPPIVKTIALHGDGIPELMGAIADHRQYLEATDELARRDRLRLANELDHILRDELTNRLLDKIDQAALADLMAQVVARQLDPYTAAQRLMARDRHA